MDTDYALFANVIEAGSLSAAARRLAISPAMVSKRLARFEARVGARLIHRTTRRLALTDIGERFHADIVDILERVRCAEARVSGATQVPSGLLRVSMPTSFGRLHIAPHLHRFLTDFPKVELEVSFSDKFIDLMADRIDLAVRITADVPTNLATHRLATSPRILCAAPGYLLMYDVPRTISDLKQHRLLAAEGQMPWRLFSGQRSCTVEQRSHVRTNSSELVRELARSGVGIALRSLWDVSPSLDSGDLVRVLPEWQGSNNVGIYAIHHSGVGATPAVEAFAAFLRTLFEPAPWETEPSHESHSVMHHSDLIVRL